MRVARVAVGVVLLLAPSVAGDAATFFGTIAPRGLGAVAVDGNGEPWLVGGGAGIQLLSRTVPGTFSGPTHNRMVAGWSGDTLFSLGGGWGVGGGAAYEDVFAFDRVAGATFGSPTLVDRLPFPLDGAAGVWDGTGFILAGGWDGTRVRDTISYYVPPEVTPPASPWRDGIFFADVARLPAPVYGASGFWDGEAAYFVGGLGRDRDEIWRYTPTTGRLEVLTATLPAGREDVGIAWNGAQAFLMGGFGFVAEYAADTETDEIVVFTPATGAVQRMSERLTSRRDGVQAAWAPSFGGAVAAGGCSGNVVPCAPVGRVDVYRPEQHPVLFAAVPRPDGRSVDVRCVATFLDVLGEHTPYTATGGILLRADHPRGPLRKVADACDGIDADLDPGLYRYAAAFSDARGEIGRSEEVLVAVGPVGLRPEQNDLGSGGDAGNSAATPTPVAAAAYDSGSLFGTLAPAVDEVDAYILTLPADGSVVEFTVTPPPSQDIRLEVWRGGALLETRDDRGLGSTERYSAEGAVGGAWTFLVRLKPEHAQDRPEVAPAITRDGAVAFLDQESRKITHPVCEASGLQAWCWLVTPSEILGAATPPLHAQAPSTSGFPALFAGDYDAKYKCRPRC